MCRKCIFLVQNDRVGIARLDIMCATHYNSSSFSVIKPTHLGYYNFPNIRHFDLTLELRTIKSFVLFSSINKDSHSASLQKRLEFIWCSVKVNPHSSFVSLCCHPYSSLSRSWTNSLEGSESQLWEWFPLPGEVETQQSQILFFYCTSYILLYILFRPHFANHSSEV